MKFVLFLFGRISHSLVMCNYEKNHFLILPLKEAKGKLSCEGYTYMIFYKIHILHTCITVSLKKTNMRCHFHKMYNILFQSWEEIEISNMKNEETSFLCLWQWATFFL